MATLKFSPIKSDGDLNKVIMKLRLRFIPVTKDVINEIRAAIIKPSLIEKFNKILERDFSASMKSMRSKSSPPYTSSLFKKKRDSFEEHTIYVDKIKTHFEEKYADKPIHSSDITLALHKFNLRNNPEYFKIEKALKLYADSHNQQMYIDSLKNKVDEKRRNTPLQEKIFTWENIAFGDGFINLRDEENHLICRDTLEESRSAFNNIATYFKIQFPDLEIRVINNKLVFNDAARFKKLLVSIKINNISSYCPNLEITPKYKIYSFFSNLSKSAIKTYILELKQKYLSHLCSKQLDDYKIQYCIEQRVNMENEALENAFVFTISETYNRITVVFENIEDDRSSIVFFVDSEQYDLAMKSICDFFSSYKLNKRETLAENYVEFKDSGIIRFRRIYHNDFQQWMMEIDRLSKC